uniref:Uncharacterized protein n=1 Tax=Tanacetum cinerariifolium TaxID=118510 RepID=A0A6L2NJN7_TANCI|nr:hypothetical protein [Tanacetum cinerariifolium]
MVNYIWTFLGCITTFIEGIYARSPAQLSEGQDTQLYLDVFKKYFECCGGTSRRESTRTFKGTMLVAGSCHTNARKQKLQTADANDPFRFYSSLCSSNASKCRMVDSPRTMPVSSFHLAGSSHSEVFQKYIGLCATGVARNVQNMANNARGTTFAHDECE